MAKEPGQESKVAGQDDPLYKAWLSNGLEHLSRVFGPLLAYVLVAFAILLLVFLAVSFVYGLIWYLNPIFSANDKLSTTDRRDLVQGFASVAQAAAVGLAGAVGLEAAPIGWQLFVLESGESDSIAFLLLLATYATRLLAQALSRSFLYMAEPKTDTREPSTNSGKYPKDAGAH